jgi:hypothetical protein
MNKGVYLVQVYHKLKQKRVFMEQEQLITEYDAQIQTRELQMLKAILPFVHTSGQMPLAIMIQTMEFQNTMRYFRSQENQLSALSVASESDRKNALLQTLKRFCTPKERETIDTLLNIMCVMENYDKEDGLGRFIAK